MTVTAMPAVTVPAPPRTPVPFGLFSTVTFRPQGARWQGGVQFETSGCAGPLSGIGFGGYCADPNDVAGLPRDLDGDSTPGGGGGATPFTIVAEHKCSPVANDHRRLAEERLLAGEERAVEQAFATGMLGNTPNLADAEALTAGPVSFNVAIGLLEEWIGREYGTQGVLHVPRLVAAASPGALRVAGQTLRTFLGTPVAAGTGYTGASPDGESPTGLTRWIYATPTITGYRSEPEFIDVFDRTVNDQTVFAQRDYLLMFEDCGVAAAQVTLASPSGGGDGVVAVAPDGTPYLTI